MHFLLDADLPRSAANALRQAGHAVDDVRDVLPPGATDSDVSEFARAKGLCLVSADVGFADVRKYPPERFQGIVILRLGKHSTSDNISKRLTGMSLDRALIERLPQHLAIVETDRTRIRPRT